MKMNDITSRLLRKVEKLKLPRRPTVILFYFDGESPPPSPAEADAILVREVVVPSATSQREDNGHASEHQATTGGAETTDDYEPVLGAGGLPHGHYAPGDDLDGWMPAGFQRW